MSKKSQNLSPFLGVLALVLFVALFYWYRVQENVQDDPKNNVEDIAEVVDITDSDMVLALLPEVSVSEVMGETLKGTLVQLNDHMEPTGGYEYISYIGKTYNNADQKEAVSIALARYTDKASAQKGVDFKAGKDPRLTLKTVIGDYSLAHYSAATAEMPDSVSVRFVLGNVSAKLQIWDLKNKVKSEAEAGVLLDQALRIAQAQFMNVERLNEGEFDYEDSAKNPAMERLPVALNGATYIGSAEVRVSEWMQITGETGDKLSGFKSAGLARFKLDARPTEVVEVTVIEFEKNEQATAYRDALVVGGAFDVDNGKKIDLSKEKTGYTLDALAIITDYVTELQFARGPYLVDVTIMSPFEEIDKVAAQADIVNFGQQLVAWFKE